MRHGLKVRLASATIRSDRTRKVPFPPMHSDSVHPEWIASHCEVAPEFAHRGHAPDAVCNDSTARYRYGGARVSVLLSLIACTLLPGCTVWLNARRTILDEPAQYSWFCDRKRSVKVYKEWADRAWMEHCAAHRGMRFSEPYTAGFKDGFVDFVYAGGAGEPPPVPPRQFWNVGERNSRGHSQAEEWFAGFRRGAQVADDNGYREQTIVPASVFNFGPKQSCWEGETYEDSMSAVPSLAPLDEHHQPEPVPAGDQLPQGSLDFPEPDFPSDRVPQANGSAQESSAGPSSTEQLPEPYRDSEERKSPEQPQPNIRDPEPPHLEPTIDEIFDSAVDPHNLKEDATLSQAHFVEQRQKADVQIARTAFVTAIRSTSKPEAAPAGNREAAQRWNTHYQGDPPLRQVESRPPAVPAMTSSRKPTKSVSSLRPAEIPRSQDRAEEMFRKLTR